MIVRKMLGLCVLLSIFAACEDKSKSTQTTTGAVAPSAAPSATSPTSATGVKEGDPAPDVEMTMQDARKVKLSALKGQFVAIYFYPKDQTTGCTIEADNFRDRFDDLKKAGITVIGVSAQDAASHKAFIEKEKLPFDLAIDADKSMAKAFGVPLIADGTLHARWTFLVGKDGKIKKVWRDVTPKDHADEVLSASKA
jgi:peroxiredoxin Q/BCP